MIRGHHMAKCAIAWGLVAYVWWGTMPAGVYLIHTHHHHGPHTHSLISLLWDSFAADVTSDYDVSSDDDTHQHDGITTRHVQTGPSISLVLTSISYDIWTPQSQWQTIPSFIAVRGPPV